MDKQLVKEMLMSKYGPKLMALEKQAAKTTTAFLQAHTKDDKRLYWLELEKIKAKRTKLIEQYKSEELVIY